MTEWHVGQRVVCTKDPTSNFYIDPRHPQAYLYPKEYNKGDLPVSGQLYTIRRIWHMWEFKAFWFEEIEGEFVSFDEAMFRPMDHSDAAATVKEENTNG